MDRAAEAAALRTLAGHLGMLDGDEWQLAASGDETMVDVVGPDRSRVTIATFSRHARPEEIELIVGALAHGRMMLAMIRRAAAALRPPPPAEPDERPNPRNHAAEAAMLCDDAAFKRWLMDMHGLESPATKDRAAQKLRSLLGVTSRAEINTDEAVRDRWIALRRDFYIWKGRGRG